MATLIREMHEVRSLTEQIHLEGKRIGLVPTMGFLHQGHLSLIARAKQDSDFVLTTLFVNPTQFGPTEDFATYPRDVERDARLAFGAGADALFVPATGAIYPEGYDTFVHVGTLTDVLEGKSRPGHFRGVATIVAKLFNITRPDVAFFGQKDAQQVAVIRKMVRDLDFNIEIVVCPIIREPDGLAMSSRNTYLTSAQRQEATVLWKSLQKAEVLIRGGERNASVVIGAVRDMITHASSGVIDYISIADAITLAEMTECRGQILISLAVRFGKTRLIDNMTVTA
jgi:pantoate--beta-alanine ligase